MSVKAAPAPPAAVGAKRRVLIDTATEGTSELILRRQGGSLELNLRSASIPRSVLEVGPASLEVGLVLFPARFSLPVGTLSH
jgi:hypothetical protein